MLAATAGSASKMQRWQWNPSPQAVPSVQERVEKGRPKHWERDLWSEVGMEPGGLNRSKCGRTALSWREGGRSRGRRGFGKT